MPRSRRQGFTIQFKRSLVRRNSLNSERTKEILAELNENQLERLLVVEFGKFAYSNHCFEPLINRLTDADLIVIDDWCPSSGRAPAVDLQAVRSIISTIKHEDNPYI